MALTGRANYWNTPNYDGMLWTADAEPGRGTGTPFLTFMGGLNGPNARIVPDFDYAMSAEYDYNAPAQPSIAENTAADGPPAAQAPQLVQARNTVQIYQEAVNVTWKKLSTYSRLATDIIESSLPGPQDRGFWAPDGSNNQEALLAQHKAYVLKKMARDANFTLLQGTFNASDGPADAAQTGGVVSGISTSEVDAGGVALNRDVLQELYREVAENSSGQAFFNVPVIFAPAVQRQQISDLYGGNQPRSWEIGGWKIDTIITDFGEVGVVYEPMMPANTIALIALGACRPVFNIVDDGEGNVGRLIYTPLAKVGAAQRGMFTMHLGLDYGNEQLHGSIINLV